MEHDSARDCSRRAVLSAGLGATVGGAALTAQAAAIDRRAYDGYLEDEGTWGGVTVDATDQDEVTVMVGAEGNGDFHAFDPAALAISPGTTIRWEWTGEGGGHDVVHDAPTGEPPRLFNSEREHGQGTTGAEGFVYEFTFEAGTEGVFPYFCSPHLGSPMVGVIVVGVDHIETETVPIEEHDWAATGGSDDDTGFEAFGPGLDPVTVLVGIGSLAGLGGLAYLLASRFKEDVDAASSGD